jgi:hypothetical protein
LSAPIIMNEIFNRSTGRMVHFYRVAGWAS